MYSPVRTFAQELGSTEMSGSHARVTQFHVYPNSHSVSSYQTRIVFLIFSLYFFSFLLSSSAIIQV